MGGVVNVDPYELLLLGIQAGKPLSKDRIASLITDPEKRARFLADVEKGKSEGKIVETDGVLHGPALAPPRETRFVEGHTLGPCAEHCGRLAAGTYAVDYAGTRVRACEPCWAQIVAYAKEIGGVTPPPFARFAEAPVFYEIQLESGEWVWLTGPEAVACHNAGQATLGYRGSRSSPRPQMAWNEKLKAVEVLPEPIPRILGDGKGGEP